jgi:hypothetical protein
MLGGLAAGLGLAWLASSMGFGEELGQFMMFGLIALVIMMAVGYFMRRRAATQNTVANWVIGSSLTPNSPVSINCDFDIAWESDFGKIVCEVKSLSDENEIQQFRLGLGQVLEYAQKIEAAPVLMFSRRPTQSALIDAANKAGVAVLWPEILSNYSPRDLRILRSS